jgi:hypothetical protein
MAHAGGRKDSELGMHKCEINAEEGTGKQLLNSKSCLRNPLYDHQESNQASKEYQTYNQHRRRITYILIVRKESWKTLPSFQGHNAQTNHLTARHVQNNRIFVPHWSNIHGLTAERTKGYFIKKTL